MTDDNNLTPRQRRAIEALLVAPSVAAAAVQARCGERTLHRWLGDARFREALAEAQRAQRRAVSDALRREALAAVDTLAAVMGDTGASPSARVAASRTVLDMMMRDDTADLVERLERLEAALEGANP